MSDPNSTSCDAWMSDLSEQDIAKPCRFDGGKLDYTLLSWAVLGGTNYQHDAVWEIFKFLERETEFIELTSWLDVVGATRAMMYGSKKYFAFNYLVKHKDFTVRRLLASLLRHLFASLRIGDRGVAEIDITSIDEESGLPHVALMSANYFMFQDLWANRLLKDDRRPSIASIKEKKE